MKDIENESGARGTTEDSQSAKSNDGPERKTGASTQDYARGGNPKQKERVDEQRLAKDTEGDSLSDLRLNSGGDTGVSGSIATKIAVLSGFLNSITAPKKAVAEESGDTVSDDFSAGPGLNFVEPSAPLEIESPDVATEEPLQSASSNSSNTEQSLENSDIVSELDAIKSNSPTERQFDAAFVAPDAGNQIIENSESTVELRSNSSTDDDPQAPTAVRNAAPQLEVELKPLPEDASGGDVIARFSFDATQPYELSISDPDGAPHPLFKVDGDTVVLRQGVELDFEMVEFEKAVLTLTDGTGQTTTQAFKISIDDVAEAIQLADGGSRFVDTGVAETSIAGGAGDDSITGHDDGGVLDGGAGADTLSGGDGDDMLTGGAGDDQIMGGGGLDRAYFTGPIEDYSITDNEDGTFTVADSVPGRDGTDTVSDVTLFYFDGVQYWVSAGGDTGNLSSGGLMARDVFFARGGDDTVFGNDNTDFLYGGAGDDILDGGTEDDVLKGGSDDDTIIGGAGTDEAVWDGDFGDFSLAYDAGTDAFIISDTNVADGTDEGTDTVTGVETFTFNGTSYSAAEVQAEAARQANVAPTEVTFASGGSVNETVAEGGTIGSAFDPSGAVVATLSTTDANAGDSHSYCIVADASDKFEIVGDQVQVKSGQTIDFENDESFDLTIRTTDQFGETHDQVITIDVNDFEGSYAAGDGGETVTGTSEEDTITGGDSRDDIYGAEGADTITAGGGRDVIYLEDDFGADVIDGGTSTNDMDGLDFSGLSSALTVTSGGFEDGSATDGTDTLTFSDIEYVVGTTFNDVFDYSANTGYMEAYGGGGNDVFTGGSGDNFGYFYYADSTGVSFDGGGGDDRVEGSVDGDDAILGGTGDDSLYTYDGDDVLDGGEGDDFLMSFGGSDQFTGGKGDDQLIGGDDIDTAFYAGDLADFSVAWDGSEFVIADLNAVDGDEGTDTVSGIETFSFNGVTYTDTQMQTEAARQANTAPVIDGLENLIVNGDFVGGLDDWDVVGNVNALSTDSWVADDDNSFVQFGWSNDELVGEMSQTFETVVGQTYTLSFDYGARGNGSKTQSLAVEVNGDSVLLNETVSDGASRPAAYDTHTFTFTADSTRTTLLFDDVSASAKNADGLLDSVSVHAVPQIGEDAGTSAVVATLAASDAEGDTLTYALTDNSGAPITDSNFEIVGNEIRVKSGADLDFESAASHTLFVTASDAFDTSDPFTVTVAVDDMAEAIALDESGVTFIDTGVAETSITGGAGDDTITAHDDGGTLDGGAGADILTGGAGDDRITTGTGGDTVDGGEGSDTIYVTDISGGADNVITDSGVTGTDRIVLTGNNNGSFELGTNLSGIEEIDGSGLSGEFIKSATASDYDFSNITLTGVDEIHGGDAGETITGSAGDDVIRGFGGDDVLSGGRGDDTLEGSSGTDEAVWDGDLADFSIVYDSGTQTFTISDLNAADGDEGTDTVTGIETFTFDGVSYSHAEMVAEADSQLNTAPGSPSVASGGSVAENSAAGTVVATLNATDANGDALTYALTDSDGTPVTDSNFEVVGNEIRVKSGADLDFEAAESHDLYVTASDGIESSAPQAISVTVDDVAEAVVLDDTGVAFTDTGVSETSITGGDGDDQITGGAGVDAISGGAGDDTIDGVGSAPTEMVLSIGGSDRDGKNPEYEVYADGVLIHSGEVTWAQDGANSFDSSQPGAFQDVTIALPSGAPASVEVVFVNDYIASDGANAPGEDRNVHVDKLTIGDTVLEGEDGAITNGGMALPDNAIIWGDGSTVTFDTSSISVSSDEAVWDGDLADFSIAYDSGSDTFTISDLNAADSDEGTDTVTGIETFTFNGVSFSHADMVAEAASDTNTAPAGPTFASGGSVVETSATGTVVATLTATDSDGDALTYVLTDSDGNSVTDSNFEVVGHEIRVKSGAALDFEAAESHQLYVTASDGIESSAPQAIAITVSDAAEAMTLADGGVSFVDEDVAETSITGGSGDDTITAHDVGGTLDGGAGADVLIGGAGDDYISTGSGGDTVDGGEGSDTIYVSDYSGGAENFITDSGTTGTDRIVLTGNNNGSFELGTDLSGIEEIDGSGLSGEFIKSVTASDYDFTNITLTGVDEIHGGDAGETITGSAGDDYIKGFGGGDTLKGGLGDDRLEGWSGNDSVVWDGTLSDFSVDWDGNNFTITDLNAADRDEGTDTVTGVETFTFNGTDYTASEMQTEALEQSNAAPGTPTVTSGGSVSENSTASTVVATVSATDSDGDALTYALTDSAGDPLTDSNFEIVGNEIRVKSGAALDFEAAESHQLYVTASDAYETSAPVAISVTVSDTPEAIYLGDGGETFVETSVSETEVFGGSGGDIITGGAGDDTFTGDDASNLIVNGSFEETAGGTVTSNSVEMDSVGGWTDANGTVFEQHDSGYGGLGASDGDYWLDMSENGAQMDISQDLTLADGDSFQLIFDAGRINNASVEMDVYFGGSLIDTISDTQVDEMTTFSYTLEGGSGDGSDTLRFVEVGSNMNVGTVLDNVRVYEAGDDTLDGAAGDDILSGGYGSDQITGGTGDDTIMTGDGADVVHYALGDGNDTVTGGTGSTWVDAIDLDGFASGATQTAADTVEGNGWTLVLDAGHAFDSVGANALELSDDAAGMITFDDGGTIDFSGIERISL